jgi:translation initiation factor 1
MEICPKCGLPMQACVCEQITKGSQRIKVTLDKKRYGKIVTVVTGFDSSIDVKKIAKSLKNELACGGTSKNNEIELQGDHSKKIRAILVKLGFNEESID